eukprot:TRINITY_DN87_c1_g1_i4.p1 TRINITY_DN87_c1_g1~~TRINITY_DN87_c1_g1_i4.p1  ORF type:complete len:500 (-),score=111.68 TRINITY_DN87_c1_g1_i4:290-1789(-)
MDAGMQQMMQQMMMNPQAYQQMQQMMQQMHPPHSPPQVAAAPAAPASPAAPAGEALPQWVEEQLEAWVRAKRTQEFAKADSLRASMRSAGYDPDKLRPHIWETKPREQQPGEHQSQPGLEPGIPTLAAPLQVGMIQNEGDLQALQQTQQRNSSSSASDVPDWVEAEIDRWVEAKRNKDFANADSIRASLRAEGYDPDKIRPHVWEAKQPKMQQSKGQKWDQNWGQNWQHKQYKHQDTTAPPADKEASSGEPPEWVEKALETWVRAKREKDFEMADRIRGALRKNGFDPDILRPHVWEAGPPGSAPAPDTAISDTVIFISGLPRGIQETTVRAMFDSYGFVEECRVFSTNAKVRYRSKEEAKWVADVMNENIPEGLTEPIKVSFTPPPAPDPQKAALMEGAGELSHKGKGKGKGKDKGKDKGKNRYTPYANPIEAVQNGMIFRKTKMCMFFEKGECEKGSNCTYAHGPEELGTAVEKDLVIAANAKHQYRQQRAASHGRW